MFTHISVILNGILQRSLLSAASSGRGSADAAGVVLHLGHSGGIGNKLVAIASSLLIALLANRAAVSLVPEVGSAVRGDVRNTLQDVCDAVDVAAVRPFVAIACRCCNCGDTLSRTNCHYLHPHISSCCSALR
jgi:hypothetical protein